jgi:hypothetical protein
MVFCRVSASLQPSLRPWQQPWLNPFTGKILATNNVARGSLIYDVGSTFLTGLGDILNMTGNEK